jgi:hypothetical protein
MISLRYEKHALFQTKGFQHEYFRYCFYRKSETSGFFSLAERRNGDGFLLYDLPLQFDQPTSPDSVSFSFAPPLRLAAVPRFHQPISLTQNAQAEGRRILAQEKMTYWQRKRRKRRK